MTAPERPSFLKAAFTENVGTINRVVLTAGFFLLAFDTTALWWQLLGAAIWAMVAQASLLSAFNNGWMDGFHWTKKNMGDNPRVFMEDFLDLCEKHGVPLDEVAQMIWKEDK